MKALIHRPTREHALRLTLDDLGELSRVADVARLLDVSEGAVRELIRAGTLRHVRIGR